MTTDMLQGAIQAKVDAEIRPIVDSISEVRDALDDYQGLVRLEASQRAVGVMLAALGQPGAVPLPDMSESTIRLRTCLEALLGLLRGPETIVVPSMEIPEPGPGPDEPEDVEPAPVTAPAPAPAPARVAPKSVDPAVIDGAWRLLEQIDNIEWKREHQLRRVNLLQALVAECRFYMDKVPARDEDLQDRLSESLRFLGRVRVDFNVEAFIRGLSYGHNDEWSKVARDAWGRLSRFDQDSETPLSTPKAKTNGKTNGKAAEAAEKATHEWPPLPALRARVDQSKAILLFGGAKRPEKVRLIQERFGLEVEWYETDPSCPRMGEDGVNRVKGGKVAACLVLNGLIKHKDFLRITESCESLKVPCALAERGGVGHLETALNEIERQCSVRSNVVEEA